MITPTIRYYAKMVYDSASKKTPRYVVAKQAGFHPAMDLLKGRNGQITMYLMEKLKEGDNVPSMRLQAKGSLNFTGLKEFFCDGKLSGYAYGYPSDKKTYSKEEKANPFYDYRGDGYLFIVHQNEKDPKSLTPTAIELIVLQDAKVLIASYCKQLLMGGFEEALEYLRAQAK